MKACTLALLVMMSSFAYTQMPTETIFEALTFNTPVDIQAAYDGTNRLFVCEQPGVVRVFENNPDVQVSTVFLDITDRVLSDSRFGLLGMTFHPNFELNGYFYLHYTASSPNRSIISRFTVSASDPDQADPESEIILIEVDQPHNFHNGGGLVFGPDDGYLYISLGDGGPYNGLPDPDNNGQKRETLLGSILRINVNETDEGLNYAIPQDNPFYGNTDGFREEIWAWGIRNTWRFSFDEQTGLCWGAENGENEWEEINLLASGHNYGWKTMEGNDCFDPPSGCDETGLTLPIYEYDGLSSPRRSVIGGYVYYGQQNPELTGLYIFGDFIRGNVWSLEYDGSTATRTQLAAAQSNISTFGLDEMGELYWCGWLDGKIRRIVPSADNIEDASSHFPERFELLGNYPNPFNPGTVINFKINASAEVYLTVFDAQGRVVKNLISGSQHGVGTHKATWDGRDRHRNQTASGQYFYRLRAGNQAQTKSMIKIQ